MSEDKPKRYRVWLEVVLPAVAGALALLNAVVIGTGSARVDRPAFPGFVIAAFWFGLAIYNLWRLRRDRRRAA